jgi:hypothetical protein
MSYSTAPEGTTHFRDDDQKQPSNPNIKVDNHSSIGTIYISNNNFHISNNHHHIQCRCTESASMGTPTPNSAMQPPRGVRVQSGPLGQQSPLPPGPDISRSHDANVDRPMGRANASQSIGSMTSTSSLGAQPGDLNSREPRVGLGPSRPIGRTRSPPKIRISPIQQSPRDPLIPSGHPTERDRVHFASRREDSRDSMSPSPAVMEPLDAISVDPSTLGRSGSPPPEYTPPEIIPMVELKPLPPLPGIDAEKYYQSIPKVMVPAWGPGSAKEMTTDEIISQILPQWVTMLKML